MVDVAEPLIGVTASPAKERWTDLSVRIRSSAEYVVIPLFALVVSGLLFSLFLLALGKSPAQFFELVERGGFGTAFSIQNTLQRSAPLILTALAGAVPARIGPGVVGALTGAIWVGIAGFLRYARGVNETISSLLLTYIGIAIMNFFVEGSLRDLTNPNKPSTMPIGEDYMVGKMPGTEVHWGFAAGIVLAVLLYVLLSRTTFGFAVRIAGDNPRAARAQGLPVGALIVV